MSQPKWPEQLANLRVEHWRWKDPDDIDSFRKGELEAFITQNRKTLVEEILEAIPTWIDTDPDMPQYNLEYIKTGLRSRFLDREGE